MKIRRATASDAAAIALLLRHTFRTSLAFLPELHTPEQDLHFIQFRVFAEDTVWVAELEHVIVGFVAFKKGWIDHLYVAPENQGKGIGSTLLKVALRDEDGKKLWTFQKNAGARRFYERHGFRSVEFTDGAGNEEKEPDVLYAHHVG